MTHNLQLLILLFWPQLILAANVIQKPDLYLARPMDNVTLQCEHDDSNYNRKLWYKQEKGKGLILIGYTVYEQVNMETGFTDEKVKIQPNGTKISILTISGASTTDNAVYYCASRSGGTTERQYFGNGTVLSVLEKNDEVKGPKVSIYRPNKREFKDHNVISLVCVASGFYPEHVKIQWYMNDEKRVNLYEPVPQKSADGKSYSTSKRLTLTGSEYFNPNNKFKCEAAFLDGKNTDYKEISGEAGCSVSKETYSIHVNQGKMSYIMILCKSGLYALIVLVLVWRKKIIASSY